MLIDDFNFYKIVFYNIYTRETIPDEDTYFASLSAPDDQNLIDALKAEFDIWILNDFNTYKTVFNQIPEYSGISNPDTYFASLNDPDKLECVLKLKDKQYEIDQANLAAALANFEVLKDMFHRIEQYKNIPNKDLYFKTLSYQDKLALNAELQIKADEEQLYIDATEYKRLRSAAYPKWQEIWEGIQEYLEGDPTKFNENVSKRDAVKAQYPKPS
ncbi:MAG: hypothetical protein GTN36_05480 [Candidatus Aenigmarchaeota archaeon]|nr:hypothetical protein [Candidatus Aenigmarchaeota archaeon]